MRVKKTIAAIIAGLCMIGSTSYMPTSINFNQLTANAEEEKKEISVWDGTTYDTSWYDEEETEFHISTPEEFAGLFAIISTGIKMKGQQIILDKDIFLNDINEFDEESKKEPTNAWKIKSGEFSGTFDGNKHIVYGYYGGTIIGTLSEGAYFKNILLKKSKISAPLITTCNGNISDCNVDAVSTASAMLCSINNGIISNCTSNGSISCKDSSAGICYESTGIIEKCINNANIIVNSKDGTKDIKIFIGGICANAKKLEDCINNGNIEVNHTRTSTKYYTTILVGGIAGSCINDLTIERCGNNGNISCKPFLTSYIGGICGGRLSTSENIDIKYCYNTGNILCNTDSGKIQYVGGLAGDVRKIESSYSAASKIEAPGTIYTLGRSSNWNSSYYLNTVAAAEKVQIQGTAKSAVNMKKEEFAKLLGDNFVYVPDCFPILKWESENTIPRLSEKSVTINDFNKRPQLQLVGKVLDKVTWMSSNPEIATVDNEGVITPISNGKATIYAICGDSQTVCEVTVNAYTIDQKQITLTATENAKIKIKQNETIVNANIISFVSSDSKIATVDNDGTIKGIAEGSCTITATIEDVELSCAVTVNKKEVTTTAAPLSPSIDKQIISVKSGEKSEIKVMNYSGDINWISADAKIAKVTKGKENTATIEGVSEGTTTIYAMISSGKNLTCEVTISKGETTEINYGDANCDSNIDLADAVLIMQSIANPSKFGEKGTDKLHITAQGKLNGDVSGNGDGVTNKDALAIQKYTLQLIKTLPE